MPNQLNKTVQYKYAVILINFLHLRFHYLTIICKVGEKFVVESSKLSAQLFLYFYSTSTHFRLFWIWVCYQFRPNFHLSFTKNTRLLVPHTNDFKLFSRTGEAYGPDAVSLDETQRKSRDIINPPALG